MKLTPLLLTGSMLFGIASADDPGMPNPPGYSEYGAVEPPTRFERPPPRGLHIERGATEQAYYMRIHTGGLAPEAVQVMPVGRSLLISVTQALQSEYRHTPPQTHPGYTQWGYGSYRSSGIMQRRFSVPRDADIGAMQRTDNGAVILITLPRYRGTEPPGQYDLDQ